MAKHLTSDQLNKVTESLLYELLMLESALLLRDKRYFFVEYPGLNYGTPQIAHDVIRLKSRLLLSFFLPKRRQKDDIVIDDFSIDDFKSALNSAVIDRLNHFDQKKINKWTVHLTETRTNEPEYSKTDRQLMEQSAMDLLYVGNEFIEHLLERGFELKDWAKMYYQNFKRLYEYLCTTDRIEEGKGERPSQRISLEDLPQFAEAWNNQK